ncbi:MAG: AsmA protein [Alphaproteobacteria bacterium]|nr:MAG: AsmA protein [Alphaproteobacteria bacterium]
MKATLDGAVDTATGGVTGKLETSGASVRALLDWLGSPLPPGPGFAAFDVKSQFAALGPRYAFTKGAFRLDAVTATGDVTVNVADNGRLAVSGALAIPALDTNTYLPAPAAGVASAGVNTSTAWDAKPMDLAGLRAADADLALAVGDLKFQKMQFANGQLALKLTNGILDARLSRVSLYGGAGTAHLLVDARGATTKLTSEIDVANVEALPLLTAAIGFDKIEGKGTLKASLTGQGRSQADIMRTLAGAAAFNFNDGAWRGVNLAQIARTVQAAISGETVGAAAKTDFAEFAATFAVAGGVANTTDLRLLNPFVRLDGTGGVDIGGQTIDMRIAPRAVRAIEGQGGRADVQGLGVPFRISGPWAKPKFAPDLGNLVQGQVQRALERTNLGGLGGLIGRPKQETTPAQPSPLDRLLPKK